MRPWFERRFTFEHLGAADFPYLVERLAGTPARVEEKTRGLAADVLTRRRGESWSIQEHVGHLVDLDLLHDARLEDYRAGASILRPADLQNRKTHEARYNERPIADVTQAFRRERTRFLGRLEGWTRSACSPRPCTRGCSSRCGSWTWCTSSPSTTTTTCAR